MRNLDAFTTLLKRDGTMTLLVGAPATPHPSPEVFNLIFRRRSIAGSMIGIPETQEMLDFCAEHGIVADIETIRGEDQRSPGKEWSRVT